MNEKMTPYEAMLRLIEEHNKGVRHAERWTAEGKNRGSRILALARKNDPFYYGQDWQLGPAEWFAELFVKLGYENKRVHLRHLHYVASGEEPNPDTGEKHQELLPDGSPYENTEANWSFLTDAAKYARGLGLVDPDLIVNRRGPRPMLFGPDEPASDPVVDLKQPTLWLPSIDVGDLAPLHLGGHARPEGYDYDTSLEPSLIECWVEKDLDEEDDPLIEAICREEGVNLIKGIGFMTIASFHQILARRAKLNKPLRILYLSDFDPAGRFMPNSPARHIEFVLREMSEEEKPDIRLRHLALTAEQVRDLDLPRIPIKPSDKRKEEFERLYGAGATELNALMHERRIVETEHMIRKAISDLRDSDLRTKLFRASQEARQALGAEYERRMNWPQKALQLIEEQAAEIGQKYVEEMQDLANRLDEELAPLEAVRERVLQAARRKLEGIEEAELPEIKDLAEEDEDAAEGWLYDSRRSYFEQLDYYKGR